MSSHAVAWRLGKNITPSIDIPRSMTAFVASCMDAKLPVSAVRNTILVWMYLRRIWSRMDCSSGCERPVKVMDAAPPCVRASAIVAARSPRVKTDRLTAKNFLIGVQLYVWLEEACSSHVLSFRPAWNFSASSRPQRIASEVEGHGLAQGSLRLLGIYAGLGYLGSFLLPVVLLDSS